MCVGCYSTVRRQLTGSIGTDPKGLSWYLPGHGSPAAVKRGDWMSRMAQLHKYHGELYTVAELSEMSGTPKRCISWRIQHGYSVEDAVDKPRRKYIKGNGTAPCGFKSMYDCLECPYPTCISESYKAIAGENATNIIRWNDYNGRGSE